MMLAAMPAVISPEDHHRASRESLLVEGIQNAPDLPVHVRDGGVVGADSLSLLVVVHPHVVRARIDGEFTRTGDVVAVARRIEYRLDAAERVHIKGSLRRDVR